MELSFEIEGPQKNTPKRKIANTPIGDGFFMVKVENENEEGLVIKRNIDQSLIQFYFALDGEGRFLFNKGNYELQLRKEKCMLFYNPVHALPLEMEIAPGSRLVFIYITVEMLHRLFVEGSEE